MNLATYILNNIDFDHIPTSSEEIIVFTTFLNQKYFTSAKIDLTSTDDSFNMKNIYEAEKTVVGQIIADLFENMNEEEGVIVTDNLTGSQKTINITKKVTSDVDESESLENLLDMLEEEEANSEYKYNLRFF